MAVLYDDSEGKNVDEQTDKEILGIITLEDVIEEVPSPVCDA